MPIPVILLTSKNRELAYAACAALASGGGIEPHVLTRDEPGLLPLSRWTASVTRLPEASGNDAPTSDLILDLARHVKAKALVPQATEDVAFVARHREALAEAGPVPVPDPDLLAEVSHKHSFTRLMGSLGLPVPKTRLVEPAMQAQTIRSDLKFPLIAKPAIGEAGEGVQVIQSGRELESFLARTDIAGEWLLQEQVPGEDVALTLLADRGQSFAVMTRKRWPVAPETAPAFGPYRDFEFIRCDWLEELGRKFVTDTGFSGVADFDLKVDFAGRQAWFLECDPRLMGSLTPARALGLNVPKSLVKQARGLLASGVELRPKEGFFLSLGSLRGWVLSGGWRRSHGGPLFTALRHHLSDPVFTVARCLRLGS